MSIREILKSKPQDLTMGQQVKFGLVYTLAVWGVIAGSAYVYGELSERYDSKTRKY